LSGFPPVEQADAQASSRNFKRDRSPNQSAAGNGNIKLFHVASLTHPGLAFMLGKTSSSYIPWLLDDTTIETNGRRSAGGQVTKFRKITLTRLTLPIKSAPSWQAHEPAPNLPLGLLLAHQK